MSAPFFCVFSISGRDLIAFQGVPCCSLPCVPMCLCGIMRFLVSKPHHTMEESLAIRHSNGHTGLSVFHVCFKRIWYSSCYVTSLLTDRAKRPRCVCTRVLLTTRPRPGRGSFDLTVVAQLVVPTTGSLFKATDVDTISYRGAVASRAIRSSCPRLA